MAQTAHLDNPPKAGADGAYEVPESSLKKLDSSPKLEIPSELAAYEVTDTVGVEVIISPEGRVKKAKVVRGKVDVLKAAAEKTVKKWAFEPYLVNGTAVPVRSEITVNFENTLDHYREPNGDVPVRSKDLMLKKTTQAKYPPEVVLRHIEGTVELRAIVGEDGHIHALHIVKGDPMLVGLAYNAVRQWEYIPYMVNGKSVPVDTTVLVNFHLPKGPN